MAKERKRRRKWRMRQLPLPFDIDTSVPVVTTRTKRPRQRPPLRCYFGTAWLDHFDPPIGTGNGCKYCRSYKGIGTETDEELAAHGRSQSTRTDVADPT